MEKINSVRDTINKMVVSTSSSIFSYVIVLISTILIIQPFLAHAQQTPTISYITPDIISKIGGTVDMDCSVLYSSNYPVLWMKLPSNCNQTNRGSILNNNQFREAVQDSCTPIPLSSESTLIIRDNRFSMRYDTASATYTLQVKDVQRSDEATYQCQIIVGINNKVTKHLTITVSQPPVIADNSTRSIVAQENYKAELICHASGSPKPIVSWRRENNQILPTGGIVYRGNVLTIHTLKKEDRGTYYCVADNGIGKAAQRAVAVDVEFPPVVTTTAPSVGGGETRIGQALGYSVELVCHIEAFPRPTITWISPKKNQLTTNLNYVVDNGYQTADDHTETSVRIKRLGRQHLGKYICRAQNKLGTKEQVIEVVETYTPNCDVGLCDQSASSASRNSVFITSSISLFSYSILLFSSVTNWIVFKFLKTLS